MSFYGYSVQAYSTSIIGLRSVKEVMLIVCKITFASNCMWFTITAFRFTADTRTLLAFAVVIFTVRVFIFKFYHI